MKSILGKLGPILSFLKFLLSLAEFCKVEGSSFFDLLRVGLDLLLECGSKLGHAILVLLILIILELELLDLALSLLVTLHGFSSVGLNVAELNLKLTDAGLELGHGVLSTTHGLIVGIGKVVLHLSELGFKSSLSLGLDGDMVLFSSELIGKTGGVNHGLLGLLLRVLGLVEHVI